MADSTVPVPVSPAPPPVARPGALVLGQSGFEDLLVRELTRLKQHATASEAPGFRSLREELPPHY